MRLCLLSSTLVYVYFLLSCSAVPRAKDYQKVSGRAEFVPSSSSMKSWDNGLGREPSCEELRAMWRFSKRQSRATEITNEISTYRDPFAYNVWEPHARSRSVGGGVLKGGGGFRGSGHGPVYGKVIHSAPRSRSRDNPPERIRVYEDVARHLIAAPDEGPIDLPPPPPRKINAFRYSGGGVPFDPLPPQSGSFQHLKDIVITERARELQEQRLAEEAAARSAALRDIQPYRGRMTQENPPRMNPNYDYIRYGRRSHFDKSNSDSRSKGASVIFPELLPPSVPQYVEDDFLPLSALTG